MGLGSNEGKIGATGEAEIPAVAKPRPALLAARSLTEYVEPFVRPEITTGEVVTAGLGMTQLDPSSMEYS